MLNSIVRLSNKAQGLTVEFNEVKIIGDLDRKVLVQMLGKGLIGVHIKVNGIVLDKGKEG